MVRQALAAQALGAAGTMTGEEPFVLSLSKDARIVPFDSPFVLRLSKNERRLRTGFGHGLGLKK